MFVWFPIASGGELGKAVVSSVSNEEWCTQYVTDNVNGDGHDLSLTLALNPGVV